MSNLLQEIEAQIAGVKLAKQPNRNVGTVREIGDGGGQIEGLTDAMLTRCWDFRPRHHGHCAQPRGDRGRQSFSAITPKSRKATRSHDGRLLQVPVGKGLLGRVVNVLGQPLDGKGPIKESAFYPV